MDLQPERSYLKITTIYFLISSLWIFFSDRAIFSISTEATFIVQYQTFKGLFFVLVSTYIIFKLTKRNYKETIDNYNKIKDMAFYDQTTKLPNKFLIHEKFKSWKNNNIKKVSAIYLDIRNFRNINDYYGHNFGDDVLSKVAKILNSFSNSNIFLGRYESDEFVFLLKNYNIKESKDLCDKIFKRFEAPIFINNRNYTINVSAGISMTQKNNYNDLLRKSYIALDKIKKSNTQDYLVFKNSFLTAKKEKVDIQNKIKKAIEQEDFQLYMQPIYSIKDDDYKFFEVLLRWPQKNGNFIPPNKFIKIAENTGQIREIDLYVIKQVIKICNTNRLLNNGYKLSINLSSINITSTDFLIHLKEILNDTSLELSNLVFEITETALMNNLSKSITFIKEIKKYGVKIALDDFGTGFSSLSYLSFLPIDILKLDKSFIDKFSDKNSKVVKSIIQLGHELNLCIVAEGIETESQLKAIVKMDCEYAQGYYFEKPLPFKEIKTKYITKASNS